MNKFSTLKRVGLFMLTCIFTLLVNTTHIDAQPVGFSDQLYLNGWNQATGITFDDNGRLYVWEKEGTIWIVENGVRLPNPLLDISEEVGDWRDFGLVGFALDPNFLTNGHIYLWYVVDRHHLLNFGTGNYNPNTNEYFNATIGRITRYTAQASNNFNSVDTNSRLVLLGETKETGAPILHESHGVGDLVFGTDGTLIACMGDGASFTSTDQGSASETYWSQALTDGIITPAENIGAYRSQSLNSLNGKIIRIDPSTGNGVPSNPFYNGANPRSVQSRTWSYGVRNPYRMTKKPDTGSHIESDGDPGVFYFGDVGWNRKEELNVIDAPGLNFGWPAWEGMDRRFDYNNSTYLPATHENPRVDWRDNTTPRAYINNTIYNVGSTQFPGPVFGGNASTGGVWYTGDDFPEQYRNTYFHADFGDGWIRNFVFDQNHTPNSTSSFLSNGGPIVKLATSTVEEGIFYIKYPAEIRRITYTGSLNQEPVAIASSDISFGSGPLTVQFSGDQSADPDGSLSYLWNFGDGNTSTSINPTHTYNTTATTSYTATLTVTDDQGATDQASVIISLNNTPPIINSTSIDNLNSFSPTSTTTVNLSASASDAQSNNSQLSYSWQLALHHNDHNHLESPINSQNGSLVLSPIGCDGATYWYRITLTVTDPGGLSDTFVKDIYPSCTGSNQTINFAALSDQTILDNSFNLNATASSGLPINYYVVDGPASVTGNTVTLTGTPGEVTILAAQNGNATYAPAIPVEQSFSVTTLSAGGSGITGTYFNNIDLTNEVLTRVDPTIDFSWGTGSPDPSIGINTFSVRWEGELEASTTETYTFTSTTDDGVRLWVNDQLIINQWIDQAPTAHTGTIALTAGQRANFKMEYYENGGGAVAQLRWSSPSVPLQLIPQTSFFPVTSSECSFTDRSDLLPNQTFTSGVAMAIVDMNGDDKDDIVHFNNARNLNIEYQQAPNANFTNFNYGDLSTSNEWSTCIADVDQNGYNDILAGGAYNNIQILKANGSGSNYTASTLPSSNIFLQGSNFVDIDNDGWVDVFACHDDADSRNYRNTQDGNFVFDNSLINTTLPSGNSGNYASIWTDYDNDGDLDMYLSKCRQGVNDPTDPRRINLLYQNDGNNNFTEVGAAAGLRIGDQSWVADFADIDNDGDMDVFIINHFTSSLLFINNGDGTFTDITASSGMADDLDLFGIQSLFRDFDNDGFVDLIVTGTEHRLFKNNGNGTFSRLTNPFGINDIESIAVGDLNSDGFLDIYAGYANLFNSPTSINDQIFMNDGNSNNFLTVTLDGTVSNINGIGARIELYGPWGIQIREIRSGEGYGIQNSLNAHFGIGSATQITRLVVKWPSGVVNEILNPAPNQFINVVETPTLQDQTINFPALSDKLTTDIPFTVNATASSGLPANYSIVSGPATISGNTITLNGTVGTVVVQASQAGNSQYNAAPNVNRSFNVTQASSCDCEIIPLDANMVFSTANNSNLTGANTAASLVDEQTVTGDPICGTGGTANSTWFLPWGTSSAYIDLGQEYDIYGIALFDGPGAGDFVIAPGTPGNWDPEIINYTTTGYFVWENYENLNVTTRYLRVDKLSSDSKINEIKICGTAIGNNTPPAITITSPVQLGQEACCDITVEYNLSGDIAGNNVDRVRLTLDNNAPVIITNITGNYTFNNVSLGAHTVTAQLYDGNQALTNPEAQDVVNFDVANVLQDQIISFPAIPNKLTTDAPFTINATASSGLNISYTISGPATLSGNTVTLNGTTGTVSITASQAGNSQYNAAPNVIRTFSVTELTGCNCSLIPLTASMIFNVSDNNNVSGTNTAASLVDEQNLAGDPVCADGNTTPTTDWYLPWGSHAVYIDLGQEYNIYGIALLDGPGIGAFEVTTGIPGSWNPAIIDFNTEGFNVWQNFDNLNVTSRYIRLDKLASDSKIKEIRICGTPVGITGPPMVSITAPAQGSNVACCDVTVNYTLSGDIAGNNVDHLHLTLDNEPHVTIHNLTGTYTFTNVSEGAHTITAQLVNSTHDPVTNPEATDVVNFNVVTVLQDQTITFSPIPNKLTTDAAFTINASANSGLPVSYVIAGPATLSGNTVTLNGTAGVVSISAGQAGNSQYNPASNVIRTFIVSEPGNNPDYCAARGEQPWQQWIENVNFAGINNTSEKDGYGNFLGELATVTAGGTHTISLTPGFSWQHWDEYFNVFIDFNQDNDFDDTGELVFSGISNMGTPPNLPTPPSTLSGSISIPSSASNGTTRMRITMQQGAYAGPCETFTSGEVEDYSVNIIGGSALNSSTNELLILNASNERSAVRLNWLTNTEYKNDYFILEQSNNGIHFKELLQKRSEGDDEAPAYYDYTDVDPALGENYYRIKQVFTDGSLVYSNVEKLIFKINLDDIVVFPNPVQEILYINMKNYEGRNCVIQVVNNLGQVMSRKKINYIPTRPVELNLNNFQNGIYFLSISIDEQKSISRKISVQRNY